MTSGRDGAPNLHELEPTAVRQREIEQHELRARFREPAARGRQRVGRARYETFGVEERGQPRRSFGSSSMMRASRIADYDPATRQG
jgi:hypothetical protein